MPLSKKILLFKFINLQTEQSCCYSWQAFVYCWMSEQWPRASTYSAVHCVCARVVLCVRLTIKRFRLWQTENLPWSMSLTSGHHSCGLRLTQSERGRVCDLGDSRKFGQECQRPQDILVSRQRAHKFTSANYTAAIRSQQPIRELDPFLNHCC